MSYCESFAFWPPLRSHSLRSAHISHVETWAERRKKNQKAKLSLYIEIFQKHLIKCHTWKRIGLLGRCGSGKRPFWPIGSNVWVLNDDESSMKKVISSVPQGVCFDDHTVYNLYILLLKVYLHFFVISKHDFLKCAHVFVSRIRHQVNTIKNRTRQYSLHYYLRQAFLRIEKLRWQNI